MSSAYPAAPQLLEPPLLPADLTAPRTSITLPTLLNKDQGPPKNKDAYTTQGGPSQPPKNNSHPYHDSHSLAQCAACDPGIQASLPIIAPPSAAGRLGSGFGFHRLHFLKVATVHPTTFAAHSICADTGCGRSMADKTWVATNYPELVPRAYPVPLTSEGIGSAVVASTHYVLFPFRFTGLDHGGRMVATTFEREVSLVDGLSANLLMGLDILVPDRWVVDLPNLSAYIASCEISIPVFPYRRPSQAQRYPARAAKRTTVQPRHHALVAVSHNAPANIDSYLLEPAPDLPVDSFALLTDHLCPVVLLNNPSANPITVDEGTILGTLAPVQRDVTFWAADPETCPIDYARKSATVAAAVVPPALPTTPPLEHSRVLPTGITIYDDPHDPAAADQYEALVTEFGDVFTDTGFVDIPQEQWLQIPLRPDWPDLAPKHTRPYHLNARDQKVVDDTLSKLEAQGKISRTKATVPFSFPIFVVWRTVDNQPKGRMVVDIRGLNRMCLPDSYPMRTQELILAHIAQRQAKHITVMDANAFYYQWRVHPDSRWALTVTSDGKQFTFNCCLMGYRNSNAYVARHMDIILEGIEAARTYSDDLDVADDTVEHHLESLRAVLLQLRRFNISIGPAKTFVGFPTVNLLGKVLNGYSLTTKEERLAAIRLLSFPDTLANLETFVGLVTYLRNHVPRFAQKLEPLQERKTAMLAARPKDNSTKQQRRQWTNKTKILQVSPREQQSFETIKSDILTNITLFLQNILLTLFIEFDASLDGIGVRVFQVLEEELKRISDGNGKVHKFPAASAVRPIAFLSRTMTTAEKEMWPTELEVTGLAWALAKCSHWITASRNTPTVVFTDHDSIVNLSNQTSITSTGNKLSNKRILRAMQRVNEFDIQVIHRSGSSNTLPDALSRLPRDDVTCPEEAPAQLDVEPDALWPHHCAFNQTDLPLAQHRYKPQTEVIFKISPELKTQFRQGYEVDTFFKKTIQVVNDNDKLPVANQAQLSFFWKDGLLWQRTSGLIDRLCVPRNLVAKIFALFHGPFHNGYEAILHCLQRFYIPKGSKLLKTFVDTCLQCKLLKRPHLKPAGSLQPIIPPPCPYFTICMDFILALPLSAGGEYDTIMVIIDKFSRQAFLLPGRNNYSTAQWAHLLFTHLLLYNWGIPKSFISDRDPKFVSALWRAFWETAGVLLLHTAAYHPAADGLVERLIQTLQTFLRMYLNTLEDPREWPAALPALQFAYNNHKSSATSQSPNETVLGFTPNDLPALISAEEPQVRNLPLARLSANDAMHETAILMKQHYDQRHRPIFFEAGQRVLLRVGKGYNVPSLVPKLSPAFAGPFRIIERIGRSAYRLELPAGSNIHDVVSLQHLAPCPADPFGRSLPAVGPVVVDEHESFIVRSKGDRYLIGKRGLDQQYWAWKKMGQMTPQERALVTARTLGQNADLENGE